MSGFQCYGLLIPYFGKNWNKSTPNKMQRLINWKDNPKMNRFFEFGEIPSSRSTRILKTVSGGEEGLQISVNGKEGKNSFGHLGIIFF